MNLGKVLRNGRHLATMTWKTPDREKSQRRIIKSTVNKITSIKKLNKFSLPNLRHTVFFKLNFKFFFYSLKFRLTLSFYRLTKPLREGVDKKKPIDKQNVLKRKVCHWKDFKVFWILYSKILRFKRLWIYWYAYRKIINNFFLQLIWFFYWRLWE